MSTSESATPEEIRASVRAMRRSYGEVGLVDVDPNPITQFSQWLAEAAANPMVVEANAMILSTSENGVISSRTVLLKDVTGEGEQVPRPPHWGGYLVRPSTIELWQGRYSRLHDRVRYIATNEGWAIKRFYP